jgi:hypothetical protein
MSNEEDDLMPNVMSVATTRLLAGGVAAAPVFAVVALVQAATRPGFDLTRHAVSLLGLGDLGWIQNASFLLTGLLTIAGAIGMGRALPGPGGRWAPRLLVIFGVGCMAGGIFHADPGDAFPPGTPAGIPTTMSWHGSLHMAFGGIGFLALFATCFVLARAYMTCRQRGWAAYCGLGGALGVLGFFWAMSGGQAGSLTLFVGVVAAWACVGLTARRLISSGEPRITPSAATLSETVTYVRERSSRTA